MGKLQAPNYTQLPNALIAMLPLMSEAETKISIIIARETFGWHRPKVRLSLTDLVEMTGLTRPGVIKGVKAALERGIVGREKAGQGFLYFLIVDDELPEQVVNTVYQLPDEASKHSLPALVNTVDQQLANTVYQYKEERKGRKKVKENHTPRARAGEGVDVSADKNLSRHVYDVVLEFARQQKGINSPLAITELRMKDGHWNTPIDEWLAEKARREKEASGEADMPTEADMPGERDDGLLREFLGAVETKVNRDSFAKWFGRVRQLNREGRVLHVWVPGEKAKEWIESNYGEIVGEAMAEIGCGGWEIRYHRRE